MITNRDPEFVDTVTFLYAEQLGREPDPGGLAAWVQHAREGWTGDQIRQALHDSAEGVAFRGNIESTPIPPQAPPSAPAPAPPMPHTGDITAGPHAGGRVLRVTDASDGTIAPRDYAYWAQAWVDADGSIVVFAGVLEDGLVHFWRVHPDTGAVDRLGAPLPQYRGTGEGWAFEPTGGIYLVDGPRLRFVSPLAGADRVVFDISDTHPMCDLWQPHASDDGQTFSATVRQVVAAGAYPAIGTVVFRQGVQEYFGSTAPLDESAIAGPFLIIKENNDDNRVVNLETGEQRVLLAADGGVGHSDCGDSLVVGADRQHGACVRIDLRGPLTTYRALYSTWTMGDIALRGDMCLVSDVGHISRVALDGSGVTPLIAHGMVLEDPDPYDDQVRANIDHSARWACYMTNNGTPRQDVYLLELPS